MAMELMGARTMQRMAAERDAIARQSPVVHEFYRRAKEEGLKAAVEWRDCEVPGVRSQKQGARGLIRGTTTLPQSSPSSENLEDGAPSS